MKVFDVLVDKHWQEPLLDKLEKYANTDHHHNSSNYRNFANRLPLYDSLYIIVNDNNEIEAMSGLFNGGIYPPHLVRALDRTLYFNWTKTRSDFNKKTQYSSRIFWPLHLKKAIDLDYSGVFFSIQNIKKRRVAALMAKRTGSVLLDKLYNTCPQTYGINDDLLCWQNIVFKELKPCNFDLPSIGLDEYEKKSLASAKKIR